MPTIAFVKKEKSTLRRTKYVTGRHSFIKEKVDEGKIEVVYTPTLEMHMFTKPLQGKLSKVICKKVLWYYTIYCIKDVEL